MLMAIQWFPGHMNRAKREIEERLPDIDVVIEMLDARLPASSENPLLGELTADKPKLKILNKQDLADPTRTNLWLDYYNAQAQTRAIGLDASDPSPAQKLIAACRGLAPHRGGISKPLRVMICGIPNVGKSTLINTITNRKITKTGNIAGVTKMQQRILLADDFELFDTPGMLWPKIIVEEGGYNLAASGGIGSNAMDAEDVALTLLAYLHQFYLKDLCLRYRLDDEALDGLQAWQVLEKIGRSRGAILSGGRVHLQKAAESVLTDFRDGIMGRITLETPSEWGIWHEKACAFEAAKAAAKAKHEIERRARFHARKK
jgi:ribosome biogenesis GTPase A